jgi:hypothetical protein
LGLSVAYPTPIKKIPEISHMFDGKRIPSARRVSEHILAIASAAVPRPAARLAASRARSLP